MLFKVNPTKQNIQTEQGALVVTGNCYVQLHTPLTDMRRFKVLIKQEGGKKGGKIKQKHEWSLCERPVIKLLGTSLHSKRHTHTHSHTNVRCIHAYTLTSVITGPFAVTPLIEDVSVSEEKYNICRPREVLGRGERKKAQQGIILATCDLFTTLPSPPIWPPTIMLVTILRSTVHFLLCFDALCGSVYLMSCAKKLPFFFFFFLDNSHSWIVEWDKLSAPHACDGGENIHAAGCQCVCEARERSLASVWADKGT